MKIFIFAIMSVLLSACHPVVDHYVGYKRNQENREKFIQYKGKINNLVNAVFGYVPGRRISDNKPIVVKVIVPPFTNFSPNWEYPTCPNTKCPSLKACSVFVSGMTGLSYYDGKKWHTGLSLDFVAYDFEDQEVPAKLNYNIPHDGKVYPTLYMFPAFEDAWKISLELNQK